MALDFFQSYILSKSPTFWIEVRFMFNHDEPRISNFECIRIQQILQRMSKFAPVSPMRYNPSKKVERLYFPQYGDPSLFIECGKKHFNHSPTFKYPYASSIETNESLKLIKAKLVEEQFEYNDGKVKDRASMVSKQKIREGQRSQRVYHDHPPKEALEEYVDRFRHPNRPQIYEQDNNNFSKPIKMKTEAPSSHGQQAQRYILPNLQPRAKRQSESIRQRIKTQLQPQPQPHSKKRPRFNPTFLSSLQY